MKPLIHAQASARKYGGQPSDYQDIHDFLDMTKAALPDMRHRMVLHNAMGCFIASRVFGEVRTNSAGRPYSVRDVAEDHIIQDLGFLPTLEKCFSHLPMEEWMGGSQRAKTRTINYEVD
jgi:hypothetical protein